MCAADSIEANVESADTHVHSGTQQLSRAADYQVNQKMQEKRPLPWNNVIKMQLMIKKNLMKEIPILGIAATLCTRLFTHF